MNKLTLSAWQYSFTAGISLKAPDHSVYVNFRSEDSRQLSALQSVCHPATFGPDGTDLCEDLAIGTPSRLQKRIVDFDVRVAFSSVFAARLIVSNDMKNSVTGVSIPLYGFMNKDRSLVGGGKIGYRSDNKRTTFSVFISTFKL